MKGIRLNGERFGRLVVLGRSHINARGMSFWHCLCDCDTRAVVSGANIKKRTKSCGCRRRDLALTRKLGYRPPPGNPKFKTRTYRIWLGMMYRCSNPKAGSYHLYGGKGIKVCERWVKSFDTFLADMGPAVDGRSIDRIDGDKDYEPNNCRWATPLEQSRNSKRNHWIEWNGQRKIVSDWALIAGINVGTLILRLRRGWAMATALATPTHGGRP